MLRRDLSSNIIAYINASLATSLESLQNMADVRAYGRSLSVGAIPCPLMQRCAHLMLLTLPILALKMRKYPQSIAKLAIAYVGR